MADRIKSIFGPYSEKMQVMIDTAKDKFAPVWFTKYLDWGTPKTTLTFETAIGRSRIEAAASVVDRSASAPLRGRPGLEKLRGEVPAIKEKFAMTESDYRDWEMLKAMSVNDGTKLKALLDLLFNDVKKVGDASLKRLDFMVLQGISTGKVNLSLTNNPDGIVTGEIDLLMPAENKRSVSEKWSVSATATPVTDIKNAVDAAEERGIAFEKILMTRNTFWKFQKCDETIKMLNGFFRLNTNQKLLPTFAQVNEYLQANLLPTIELVNEAIGIEKDGKISVQRPFEDTAAVLIPAGKLGIVHNAVCIEEMKPVAGVSYAKYERSLISKWSQNDPFGEYTAVELNAFPGIEAIDSIFILNTETKA